MKIKTSSFAAAVAVLLALLVFVAPVSADLWTDAGNFNSTWFDAEGGTTASEYHIYDAASLAAFAEKTSVNASTYAFSGKTIYLEADINLIGHEWMPIGGNFYHPFSGIFNGKDHVITNLTVDSNCEAGLFGGIVNGAVSSLTIDRATVTSSGSNWYHGVGALVGYVFTEGGQTSISNIIISNSKIESTSTYEKDFVGGIGGVLYIDELSNCQVINCEISGSSAGTHEEASTGGIAGMVCVGSGDSATVSSCTVDGTTISGYKNVGGLIGAAWSFRDGISIDCSTVSSTMVNAESATGVVNPFVGKLTIPSTGGDPVEDIILNTGNSVTNVEVSDAEGDTSYTGTITTLNPDEIPETPATPSQPATPSSSSSVTPTPGAYYNYPRTVTDGGLVEFGTSKVVKSVTLPAGSSGNVNLHIDSTAYWPLSLDSEFTFDISVDNLGEGTSYISFKIAESKLTALELTAADVGVYHNVNGEWVKLVVTYTIEDGDVIYTAETDSFSPFKLVIEEGAAVQKEEVTPSEPVVDEPVIPDVPQDVPGEVLPDIPDVQDEPETPASPAPVLGLLAALGAAVVLRRK